MSQIPDDVEDCPRWSKHLKLYKPMVTKNTVAHMEIRRSDSALSPIPKNVYITQFTNLQDYLVISNLENAPYTVTLRDKWQNRETNEISSVFTVPPKRMIFIKKG